MVFSSAIFIFLFLPITIFFYFICNERCKNLCLLLASLFFYTWGEPKYIVLMLISIIINYIFGLCIENANKYKIVLLAIIITINLGLLFYFKYFNFFIANVTRILPLNVELPNIALPIGISFFTFQIMSYVIDVYWGNVKAQKNIFNLGLYISFFPQLIAGPIVRYLDIEKMINSRSVDRDQIYLGIKKFMLGFSKKILIADQLAPFVNSIFSKNGISGLAAWMGAIAYALQIFYDFSGYSDMAIGLGRIFGFEFVENFNYPYISSSIKEFWRRWHISLSTWFKDYVYIPLGGSRCSVLRSYSNLIVVFFLTGFWHGASWNFIVWGLYYAFFLIVERIIKNTWGGGGPRVFQHLYALIVIIIGWVFFRAETLTAAISYIKNMFRFTNRSYIDLVIEINKQYIFCIIIGIVFSVPIMQKIEKKINNDFLGDICVSVLFIIAISYMLGSGFSPFLYFRF